MHSSGERMRFIHPDEWRVKVFVIYATPERQFIRELEVSSGATLLDAVRSSGVLEGHPELNLAAPGSLGVFGRARSPDTPLREGDQVEIYRPLKLSPMEARRLRARKKTG